MAGRCVLKVADNDVNVWEVKVMEIDKGKLSALAADCHNKQTAMQNLHQQMQKGGTPETAGQYAIAKVEYNRAKNLLDLEVRNQSVTIIPKVVHASDCALHNAPAMPCGPCNCGADQPSKDSTS